MKHAPLIVAVFATLTSAFGQGTGFRSDVVAQISYVQDQLLQLEEAIPQKTMTWRPGKGVRSVSEVYNHIAFGNYQLMKFAGVDLPSDITLPDFEHLQKWDGATTDKKEIAERMKKSFEHVKSSIEKMSDETLDEKVEFFGMNVTKRYVVLTTLAHMHEHLGQSVAYARTNKIVPPWSRPQKAN